MASRNQSIYGLDLYKDAVCMAQYFPEERSIASVVINPLPENESDWWESLSTELTKLAAELKISGQDVICSLPSEWAVIKKIACDKNEPDIEDTIRWEISQQVLGSLDDYAFDHQEILSSDELFRYFLVAAFRSSAVKRVSKLMRSTKLNPVVVDIDIFALINVLETNYEEKTAVPSIIIMGDNEKLKLVLTRNGEFIDFQIVNFQNETEDFSPCLTAIQNAVAALSKVNKSVVGDGTVDLYCTGPLFSNTELLAYLQQNLPNIEILDPFRTIACHAEIPEEDLRRYAPQLAVAVGLSVRGAMEV
ncbi:MAG: hypothetical protein GF401_14345 [Chitinivibrionales bacterium]|nr:hypothetical protein [Chitinivibrionales bacterium]